MKTKFGKINLNCHLPSIFDPEFRLDSGKQTRRRLFTNRSFFLSMIHLVVDSSTSSYALALLKSFTTEHNRLPLSKAAFCKLRHKISYRYFEACFNKLLLIFSPRAQRWKGLRVVAIDGKQVTLPRSKDIVENKFTGRKTSKYRESYMPKGYFSIAFDVLEGLICKGFLNHTLNEIADAKSMISQFGKKTLFLYDRLFFFQGNRLSPQRCAELFCSAAKEKCF